MSHEEMHARHLASFVTLPVPPMYLSAADRLIQSRFIVPAFFLFSRAENELGGWGVLVKSFLVHRFLSALLYVYLKTLSGRG